MPDQEPTIERVPKPRHWPYDVTFLPTRDKQFEGVDTVSRIKKLAKIALRHCGLRIVQHRSYDPLYLAYVKRLRRQAREEAEKIGE